MGKIGTRPKFSTLERQRENAQLELIIERFGHAMRNANREYVSRPSKCQHDPFVRFTLNMHMTWQTYVEFCQNHPE